MKLSVQFVVGVVQILAPAIASAAMIYVDANNLTPQPPYTNWVQAARTIQEGVDAAVDGDTVLVTNGVYNSGGKVAEGVTNRVLISSGVAVQSVNGPSWTVIRGFKGPVNTVDSGSNSVRCVYLAANACLSGFTITNGASQYGTIYFRPIFKSGGGILGTNSTCLVSNCIIRGNLAGIAGGGACQATLKNCIISDNAAGVPGEAYGAGVSGCVLTDCVLSNNTVGNFGGAADSSRLERCLVVSNSANSGGGLSFCTNNSCVVVGNRARIGAGASNSELDNCDLVGNSATLYAAGAYACVINSSIVWSNLAPTNANYLNSAFLYSCASPLPAGSGNIETEPGFVSFQQGNFHLQGNSRCINAGTNTLAAGISDFDGLPRLRGGTVDMGAYEFQSSVTGQFAAWLDQFQIAPDGPADFADPDGDGMNNWQEWIAGTDPTNASSRLLILPPVTGANGNTITWQSVAGTSYFVQRGSTLSEAGFSTIVNNLPGQPGVMSYTDSNTISPSHYFYRVGVR